MDIPRATKAHNRYLRLLLYSGVAVGGLALVSFAVSNLQPALPGVDRATVLVDTVKRGTMLRQVRGLGTLISEQVHWIASTTEGRVERILVKPGAIVKPDTVLLELSNPILEQSTADLRLQLQGAEAELTNLGVELESQLLTQKAALAAVESEYSQAKIQNDVDQDLTRQDLLPKLTARLSQVRAAELGTRSKLEQQRVAIATRAAAARLAVQRSKIDQLRSRLQLQQSQLQALRVRAGTSGVLQLLPPEVGQQLTTGTNLARIADPKQLKAELKIAEAQAKDVQIGQPASVDTHNGLIPGRVTRIDPAVQNGTVTVDLALSGPLPAGARLDLSVDGVIELERLEDVLYIGRPASGQDRSTVGLFKMIRGTDDAQRVQVRLGRSSVNTAEVLEGLQVGDQVILSDMSAQEKAERIRLQ
ncbi:efflux RND transporter periplasmic adaptor subunit [Gloeobacter morelensis]|uniref:HlyD family efflux transporter periplasmic adaptor subunit n=1 Tax=Gloeobacter morelensis MG652769 TaxID=2781736 RepID=A0ABY3PR87_9CYAN|nr:HlyD family efflux transporter periplasmic adaptor subunit [Gloeobacter morelensis]UFP96159.1 HlyD family efflux transporter periplasmic adaptor subunit [Gloeobacter morelensis MG652769]